MTGLESLPISTTQITLEYSVEEIRKWDVDIVYDWQKLELKEI
jgi:hypothetical protein